MRRRALALTVATALALAVGVLACGGASSTAAAISPRYPMPEPKLAKTEPTPSRPAAVACRGVPFDAQHGCRLDRAAGVPIAIEYRHTMETFVLVGAAIAVDGELRFDANDPELLARDRVPLLETALEPGKHEIGVLLVLAGNGHGVFAYVRGYRFEVRSTHELTLEQRARPRVVVIEGYERGGMSTPLEERPAVRFDVR